MRILKRSCVMMVTLSMVVFGFAACGSEGDTSTETTKQTSTDETTANTTDATEQDTTDEATVNATDATEQDTTDEATVNTTDVATTITEEEAIELVKQVVGEDFSLIPADELEEKDGSQYYVIYVKKLLETGTLSTQTIYMVKTDGSEVFDKYVTSVYVGEYASSGETGEVIFKVNEDGTFEMTTSGDVNQVVSGVYKFGITNKASVISLILHPNKIVNESNGETTEEDLEAYEGTAVIEDGKLTLTMENKDTFFTKK